MIEPKKRTGYLTQKNGQQVTVIKMIPGKALKAKSAQISTTSQYVATFYEWDLHVAFSFYCDGKHCSPKVGDSLELGEHAEENLPKCLGNEYRFRWESEDGTMWRRLEHKTENVVKFLCCDEVGELFLKDKSDTKSVRTVASFLYKIVDA